MEIAKTVILVIIIIIGGVKKVHCTQDDSYSGQGFLNKITGKIFQNFELYFLNFFLFAPLEQHEKQRKND